MRVKRGRKPARWDGAPHASITSNDDLSAHIAALVELEPHFGILRNAAGNVPLRSLDPGFRGLFWVITGQQISVAAGRAIFSRCEAALETFSAEHFAQIDDAVLKGAGLSAPKIRTLRAVSAAMLAGDLDLGGLMALEAENAIAQLSRVKGIGRWTAEVYLLFALGHPDIFPAGDLALKEGVRLAFALEERPAEKELVARSEGWRPYRSAAARLIWAYYGAVKRGGNAMPV
jgi:DNA-3-methyladenine glycosylase II